MNMIRPAFLALCALLLQGGTAARADIFTPCGSRVSAGGYALSPALNFSDYYIGVTAHQVVQIQVTLQLPRVDPHWPNGVTMNMSAGMQTRFMYGRGEGRAPSQTEIMAHTTLMCRDLPG